MFYVQELLLGLIGFGAALLPLLLPHWKPLFRFMCITGALLVAGILSAYLASVFFKTDYTLAFIRAFLMIGLLQNIAIRMPAYPVMEEVQEGA